MSLTSGSLIHDQHRLETEIGRGGMAAVYRARDEKLNRDMAVKVLSEPGLGTKTETMWRSALTNEVWGSRRRRLWQPAEVAVAA